MSLNRFDQDLMQYEDVPIDCNGNINCKVNENPVPSFHFPSTLTTEEQTTANSGLITTISNKLTTIWEHFTETSTSVINNARSVTSATINTTENILNETINEIVPFQQNNSVIIDESSLSNNNTNMIGIIENVSSSLIVDMMQNDTLSLETLSNDTNTIDMMENVTNLSTVEMMQNVTLSVETAKSVTLPETQTITTVLSTATENVASIISSTTEKAVAAVTEKINNALQKGDDEHFKHYHTHGYDHSNSWLYVLLAIIVAVLILIGVILLLIYIRYRKHSLLPVHNYYEISPMKESCSPLPPHIQHKLDDQNTNEVYSQYST